MNEAQEAFEREMRANGMFENGGTAMVRDLETGGYVDPDTNAMLAGFLLAWRASCHGDMYSALLQTRMWVEESCSSVPTAKAQIALLEHVIRKAAVRR